MARFQHFGILLLRLLACFEVFKIFLSILSVLWILVGGIICTAMKLGVFGPMIQFPLLVERNCHLGIAFYLRPTDENHRNKQTIQKRF